MKTWINILLLCMFCIAVLVAGCTSQSPVIATTVPTTVPTSVTTVTPGSTGTTETLDTSSPSVTPTTVATTVTITTTFTTSQGVTTPSPTEDKGERIRIKAKNFAFDVSRITVPASSQVIIEFENEDSAQHNVAFYTTPSLTTTIYKGGIITGPGEITYTFTAPAVPGTYYFRCDVHPSMNGQFIVT